MRGAQTWERFAAAHSSYVQAGLDDETAWRRLIADHDLAERQFQEGWQDLGKSQRPPR